MGIYPAIGPQMRLIQTPIQSGPGSLCSYCLWLWTGLAKDFTSLLDAGEELRLLSGTWCAHTSVENKSWGLWHHQSVSPGTTGQRYLADGPYAMAEAKQRSADLPLYIRGRKN